jgi:Protein of unknown function (DUF998)
MTAPALFVALFTAQGWMRAGYDPASMFVSELSLGPWGWVQIANFVITGLLLIWFASGVRAIFPAGKAARVGPLLLIRFCSDSRESGNSAGVPSTSAKPYFLTLTPFAKTPRVLFNLV